VLLAEAIEFVEVIWTRHGERHFAPFEHTGGYPKNKVSIHVPIHNEPPEMVRDTLTALSKLDYPNFEVLILDNNTVDPNVWQPVRDYCAQLGPRFRFFHLENWPGFKAGALNFGLKMTAPDADIIAVIDSDYQVEPNWLRTMVPYFEKEDVGFVQSPQDYRDRHESMFKNMCYWEYAGFFHIGMVQRNYFNAVIQHGTMTLVRKSALEKVGAWAEWCICEDAELGVKLYRAGYDSVYVNHSFGRGLTPDTLAGYIGQRFRWAYGAVQIVKHHWKALAPWSRKGGLTPAQRYYFLAGWLPWFADGLALLFTTTSIGLSLFALYAPKMVQLPVAAFLIPTIGSFVFKFVRSLWLYAVRIKDCSFIESLGAGVAALGLTHTVAKAMLNGMVTSGKPFFRTPKCEDKPPLAAALIQVREEAVMLTFLWGLAITFFLNPNFADSLSRLWIGVLLVQSVPYAAAVLLSFINVLPSLFPAHEGRTQRRALAGRVKGTEKKKRPAEMPAFLFESNVLLISAAVDVELLPVGVRIGVGDQIDDRRRDLFRRADMAEGIFVVELVNIHLLLAHARGGKTAAHVGIGERRRDDIGADAVFPLFFRKRQRQRFRRRLAHIVGPAIRRHVQGRHRRDDHDVAAFLLAHVRDDELRDEMRRHRMDAQYALEFLRVGIGDRLAARGDARIVDEDADRAEILQHVGDHPLVLVEILDRGGVSLRLASQLSYGFDGFVRGLLVTAIIDRDVGADLGERNGDRAPDAA